MSPLMIESIAVAQLAEHHESMERLRVRKQARAQGRGARRPGLPAVAARGRSILARLRLRAHPA